MYNVKDWKLKHSIYTRAKRKDAWDFLSDMSNQVRMEPGIEDIELDGEFASGTTGRTITRDHTQEWELSKVVEGKRYTITGHTRDKDLMLSFSWEFMDEGIGTRLTQHIKASGTKMETYMDIFRSMEDHVPKRMDQLAEELDRLADKS